MPGMWSSDVSTLGTPTPGRRSPVYSVLDAQYAEAAFRTGPSVSPADTAETTRPAYAESFYSNTAPARVMHCSLCISTAATQCRSTL